MKPIIELITEWESYSERHQDATVEEFCHFYLAGKKANNELFEGIRPPDLNTTLGKLIGRIGSMIDVYSKLALTEVENCELGWFYILNAINHHGEAQKIEIIKYHFLEQSTGNDLINRIIKAGYIVEREDENDKRAKLVKLSASGKALLFQLYQLLYKPVHLLFGNLGDTEKRIIINLLSETEIMHSRLLHENRNKPLEYFFEATIGKDRLVQLNKDLKEMTKEFKKGNKK